MTDALNTGPKVHFICQTYAMTSGSQTVLKVDKQFEYTSATSAEERAAREFRSDDCIGADAYSITEDPSSGEVGPPDFLVRLGNVPEFDEF